MPPLHRRAQYGPSGAQGFSVMRPQRSPLRYPTAMRSTFHFGIVYPVSFIPAGANRFSFKYCSYGFPDTISIIAPRRL